MGWETQPLRVLVVRFRRFLIRVICLIRDSDEFLLTFYVSHVLYIYRSIGVLLVHSSLVHLCRNSHKGYGLGRLRHAERAYYYGLCQAVSYAGNCHKRLRHAERAYYYGLCQAVSYTGNCQQEVTARGACLLL